MQTTGYERSFGGGSRRQRINIGAAKNKAANSGEVPSLDMRGVYAFAVQKGKAWVPQIGRVNAVMRRSGMMGKGKRVRVTYPIPLDDVNALERVSVRVEWFEERAGVFVAAYAVDQGDHPAHTVLGVVATKPCKGDGQFTVNSNDWERAVKKCRADHAAAVAVRSAAAARQPALLARQSQRESAALPGGPQMKRVTSKVGGRTRLVVDASQLWSRVRTDPSQEMDVQYTCDHCSKASYGRIFCEEFTCDSCNAEFTEFDRRGGGFSCKYCSNDDDEDGYDVCLACFNKL